MFCTLIDVPGETAGTKLEFAQGGVEVCGGLRVTPLKTKNSSDFGDYFSEEVSFHKINKLSFGGLTWVQGLQI